MTALAHFDRFWFAPAPAARLATLRILVGLFGLCYLVLAFDPLTDVGRFGSLHFVPAGPVHVLSRPLPRGVVVTLVLASVALAVPFLLGFRHKLLAPLFALSFLWVTSYRNSWGMLFHTENLLALHLIVLAAAPAADALALDMRGRAEPEPDGAYGWPMRAMTCLIAVCYVLAGVAKLKLAGFVWAGGDLLRAQIAYDNLRKIELGSTYSALGAALVQHRAPFVALAVLTLLLELGAPFALFGRRLALTWVVAAWLFHVGVLALMAIPFWYQLSFVAYAPFFRVERLSELVRARLQRRFRSVSTMKSKSSSASSAS